MSQFFKIPFGSGNRKMVAIRLADFADDEGRGIWPSVDTIAEQCEIAPRTVQRILKDFVDEGILILKQQGGGRKTSRYDFDLAKINSMKPQDVVVEAAKEASKNLPSDEGCHGVTGDNGDMRGDTMSPLGCHSVTSGVTPCHPNRNRTINEPSASIKKREGAQARDDEGEKVESENSTSGVLSDEDNPSKAAFTKRVQRFCNGETFSAGEWAGWAGSSMDWIAKQFAALSIDERKAAETWRDAYLRDMARQRIKPIPVGKFFTAKQWEALSPDVLERDAKAKKQNLPAGKTPVKDGWVNAWGPVFNAFTIAQFLKGRQDGQEGTGAPVVRVHIRSAYPVYESLLRSAEQRKGAVIAKPWHDLKDAMEFVQPSDRLDDWRDAFKEREWVWPSAFNAEAGAYLPKGGPQALEAFEQAVREAVTNNPKEDGGDDA